MCGFSQESYNRIHQLDFEQVKANIVSLVQVAKKAGYNTKNIVLLYHVYQFNTTEIAAMQSFAANLNIVAWPYYATMADPKMLYQYIDGTLDIQGWRDISRDIFIYYTQKKIDDHPRNRCTQFDFLTIDEKCNILTCCCLARDHKSYAFTNLFHDDFLDKLRNWQPDSHCLICMKKGVSPLGGDDASLDNIRFELQLEKNRNYDSMRFLLPHIKHWGKNKIKQIYGNVFPEKIRKLIRKLRGKYS